MTRVAALALVLAVAVRSSADPLTLRADALATTQSPAGLLMLETDGKISPTVSAEAVVWTAANPLPGEHAGDVLVAALRARTADGLASTQLGRFVAVLGAIRPLQIDGAAGRVQLPHSFYTEAYAGVPVQPGLGTGRAWDWVVGGRIARKLGDYGSVGVAMMEQRDDGRLVTEEVGADAGFALGKRDDLAARLAYDLANPAIADAELTARHLHDKSLRLDLYAGYRAASHLLPATSLFTVLGDIPAERGGARATWKAAPRLEVSADAGVRRVDTDLAPALTARARLALDDTNRSALTCELRRDGASDDAWTGVRGAARIALPYALSASSEVELVIPDNDRTPGGRYRGSAWPWALAALGWDSGAWHAAAAIEAAASPETRKRIDALLSLARTWSGP
ncbi:MAG TPA: hypothetical protein VFQ65_17085 [Kofleriaceae bacterium]|nr:hypothetical protein [Kofleriaceae bacterium]